MVQWVVLRKMIKWELSKASTKQWAARPSAFFWNTTYNIINVCPWPEMKFVD